MIISTPFSELLPVKNIPGVLRAVALIKEAKLNIVGGGDTKELEKLSMDLGISGRVKFFGRVTNAKAMEILEKSDVFVLNSLHEGLPHALIEALAHQVPIVATKIPAFTEVLTDRVTGILVNVNDQKDLARGIIEAQKLKAILTKNGFKLYREKFTWKAHLKLLNGIFDSIG